jgi:hypothetical protein
MDSYEKGKYNEILVLLERNNQELIDLDTEEKSLETDIEKIKYFGTEKDIVEQKETFGELSQRLINAKRESLLLRKKDLEEKKKSLEMKKVPINTEFTIDELKEFVWEGPNIGYTFRGKQVRFEITKEISPGAVDCNALSYKIVDTPYHITYRMGHGFSIVEKKGRIIGTLNEFLYPSLPDDKKENPFVTK